MIVRLSVIIVHSFLLVVAVVHKQRFLGGPPELFLYCAKFSIRGNNLGCARRLSTHATYNYAFTVNDGYCFQCRVIDSNVTTAEELLLGGPHLFSGSYCPSGWFDVVGYGCYSIGRGPMNWNDAQAYCEGQGAHLATMETAEENECLKKTLKANEDVHAIFTLNRPWFWLAGNDIDVEGDWRWVTSGQVVSFNNWMGGRPNNAGGNQHCMSYTHPQGKWSDDFCTYRMTAFCEI